MLVLRNDEGRFSVNPTPQQREEAAQRIIELSFGGNREKPDILIPPGETCRFYPACSSSIKLRCRPPGPARYSLAVVPK
jgi:hypothetical protein